MSFQAAGFNGSESKWKSILNGQRNNYSHSAFFVVKQLGQQIEGYCSLVFEQEPLFFRLFRL
jgi:hypothetical protein